MVKFGARKFLRKMNIKADEQGLDWDLQQIELFK